MYEDPIHELFRALGDPTRLAIFDMVRRCAQDVVLDEEGQCYDTCGPSVGEVCCSVNVGQSTVSHHLKELRHAGLIKTERKGRMIHCSIVPEAVERLRAFLDAAASQPAIAVDASETSAPAKKPRSLK